MGYRLHASIMPFIKRLFNVMKRIFGISRKPHWSYVPLPVERPVMDD